MEVINKIFCRFFGHTWKYNFASLANKRQCTRCEHKQKILYKVNYKPDLSDLSVWIDEDKWEEENIKNKSEVRKDAISKEEYNRIIENYKKFKEIAKFEM